jgi:hypothetical protein
MMRNRIAFVSILAAVTMWVVFPSAEDEPSKTTSSKAKDQADSNKVELYIKMTKDKNPLVRKRGADMLGKMGTAATRAVPALEELLTDSDEDVRGVAAIALDAISPVKQPPKKEPYKIWQVEIGSNEWYFAEMDKDDRIVAGIAFRPIRQLDEQMLSSLSYAGSDLMFRGSTKNGKSYTSKLIQMKEGSLQGVTLIKGEKHHVVVRRLTRYEYTSDLDRRITSTETGLADLRQTLEILQPPPPGENDTVYRISCARLNAKISEGRGDLRMLQTARARW